MPYDHMGAWGWGMGLGMLFWSLLGLVLLAFLILALVRTVSQPYPEFRGTSPDPHGEALAILAQRFARGEIDQEEYERRRTALEGGRQR